MPGSWFRKRPQPAQGKLIVVAFDLPDQSSHFFNELLGYKSAAGELGLSATFFVPRTANPSFVRTLSAHAVLDPLPRFSPVSSSDLTKKLQSFLKSPKKLEPLWRLIEAEDLSRIRAIICTQPNPALIHAAGLWLERKAAPPGVFFRFTNTFELAAKGAPTDLLVFTRLAGTHLSARRRQERLYFLVNGAEMAHSVMRRCNRRAFVVPLPKHYGDVRVSSSPAEPVVYIHMNSRSGPLLGCVGEIIRYTKSAHPQARFALKFTKSVEAARNQGVSPEIASSVEILPTEQDRDDYLANFARCSVAVLAYQPDLYIKGTSGVFVEAVGLGKPVVVPTGTWMAQELKSGRGVGTVFAESTPGAIAAAVSEALQNYDKLKVAATEFAPAARAEHSSRRALERVLELAEAELDMAPRYSLGEEVDFSDVFDSRCFMGNGWSETHPTGVWVQEKVAELYLWLDADPNQFLILRARVRPSLAASCDQLSARVAVCGQQIAEWVFDTSSGGEWRTALIPPRQPAERDKALRISFSTKASSPPISSGGEEGSRLGFLSFSISRS